MLRFNTIYGKIKTFLITVGIFFLILFYILQYYKYKQDKQIVKNSQQQYQNEILALLKLKSEPILLSVNYFTYWDEFVKCIENSDKHYFETNIASMLNSFTINSVYVFDKDFKLKFKKENPQKPLLTLIPDEAVKNLFKTRYAHFFMQSGNKLIEVFAASVHPSNDPNHITDPKGYLVVQKEWDKSVLSDLGTISGSRVEITDLNKSGSPSNPSWIVSSEKLLYWDGTPLVQIHFSRNLNLNLYTTRIIMFIILAFVILALLSANIIARKCINKPLKLVTDILKTDEDQLITELKKAPAEYGRIGHLLEDYVKQKQDLEDAKIRAENADKLKSAFLANISHEIRTPLSHIIGFTNLIDEENDYNKRIEYTQIIKNSSSNLANIIDDLIDLSKIEIGDLTLKYSDFSLNSFMKEIEIVYLNELKKRGKTKVSLVSNIPARDIIVNSDPQRIKQIMTNLLANSVKFTESGTITIGYKVENSNAVFQVSDTGTGIREEHQRKIFDQFTKFDYTNLNIGGTGIGLSIVQKITTALRGQIWFESTFQVGTDFYFSLPVTVIKNLNEIESEENNQSLELQEELKTQKSILIVEDDAISLRLIKEMLNPLNLEIYCVDTGEQAIEFVAGNQTIDLILMDIRLPAMDGYEATSRIREINKDIPIIAQTANAMLGDMEKALRAGCNNYISKPLDKFKLLEMIKIYISS